jgi:CRISPR/Cas system-associated endonuclease Cas1
MRRMKSVTSIKMRDRIFLVPEVSSAKKFSNVILKKVEPYLGFLHSEQFGKPSLVCDFQVLYRYLIDGFVIQYCQSLAKRDFSFKIETASGQKKGKRESLNDAETNDFIERLNDYFEAHVEVPRIKIGER